MLLVLTCISLNVVFCVVISFHALLQLAHFPATYDVGFAYPKGQSYLNGKRMTLRDVLAGQKLQIYMYIRWVVEKNNSL